MVLFNCLRSFFLPHHISTMGQPIVDSMPCHVGQHDIVVKDTALETRLLGLNPSLIFGQIT